MFDKVSLVWSWDMKHIPDKEEYFEWTELNHLSVRLYKTVYVLTVNVSRNHCVVQPHGETGIALTISAYLIRITIKRLLLLHHVHYISNFLLMRCKPPPTPTLRCNVCILLADILTKKWDLFWNFSSWVPLQWVKQNIMCFAILVWFIVHMMLHVRILMYQILHMNDNVKCFQVGPLLFTCLGDQRDWYL